MVISTVAYTMDNSGARRVKVIKIYKKPGRSQAAVGDLLKVIVVRLRNRGFFRVKKSELHLALVTRIAKPVLRKKKGYFIRFDTSSVILLRQNGKTPIGTRFFGPMPKELRTGTPFTGFLKIIALSSGLV